MPPLLGEAEKKAAIDPGPHSDNIKRGNKRKSNLPFRPGQPSKKGIQAGKSLVSGKTEKQTRADNFKQLHSMLIKTVLLQNWLLLVFFVHYINIQ